MERKVKSADVSPLTLAYLGDAVFELCVRNHLTKTQNTTVKYLHKAAKDYVTATAQAKIAHKLIEYFTEAELRIFKRGRNSTSHSVPKNADVVDYRHATGIESVFGYHYLNGNTDRINELFDIILLKDQNNEKRDTNGEGQGI